MQGVKRGDSLLLKTEDHWIFPYSPWTMDSGSLEMTWMFLHHTLLLLPGLVLRDDVHGGPLDALVVVGRRRSGVLALRQRTSMGRSSPSPRIEEAGYPVPGLFKILASVNIMSGRRHVNIGSFSSNS